MNCSDTFQDMPIDRVLKRVTRVIGTGVLCHLYFTFRDEGANNRVLAKIYGITVFDTIVLRNHPMAVFKHLTKQVSGNSGKVATVLQFKQSA